MNALSLLPLETADDAVMLMLERELARRFGISVRRMTAIRLPQGSYNPARRQFEATQILRAVRDSSLDRGSTVLAVTDEDLFIPMLTFVFGQAQLGGTAAVMSTARLRQQFHGLADHRGLLLQRALKEALHELGHTVGLTHCPDRRCVMTLSNTVQQIDEKGEEFCPGCRLLLTDNDNS